jgi:hypothetical protein
MLMHKSGQFFQTFVFLNYEKEYNGQVSPMTEQEKGSVVTFNSRYNYVGILRIPLKNEDTDANDLRKPDDSNAGKQSQAPKTSNTAKPSANQAAKIESKPMETDFNKYRMKLKTKNKADLGQSLKELGAEKCAQIFEFLETKDHSKLSHDELEFGNCAYKFLQSVKFYPPSTDNNTKEKK